MLLVALTGNIASGKSVVAQRLRELGALVIDADLLARQAVLPGTEGLRAIHVRWGDGVIAPDGTLNRAALRQIVFTNLTEREALNAILHPEVERLRGEAIEKARARGDAVVVCDIPLLYEKQLEGGFDFVILVHAPDELRLARLTALRGLSTEEAQAMMNSQMPAAEKRPRANFVIDNDASLPHLVEQIDRAWQAILQRSGA